MVSQTRIAVVADYEFGHRSHKSADEALGHAADALGLALDVRWMPSETLDSEAGRNALAEYDGIFAPGGDYIGKEAGLGAIRFAREQGWPFFGT